jgi:dihydroneopterin aldolase
LAFADRGAGAAPRDRIFLHDVRFYGPHGVTKAEQAVGAWFSVDAEMAVDLAPAALSDDLRATVDYGGVARRIVEIGTGPSVNLIERLAVTIADAILRDFGVDEVRVRVRKLTPAMEGVLGTPGVELTRRR